MDGKIQYCIHFWKWTVGARNLWDRPHRRRMALAAPLLAQPWTDAFLLPITKENLGFGYKPSSHWYYPINVTRKIGFPYGNQFN